MISILHVSIYHRFILSSMVNVVSVSTIDHVLTMCVDHVCVCAYLEVPQKVEYLEVLVHGIGCDDTALGRADLIILTVNQQGGST